MSTLSTLRDQLRKEMRIDPNGRIWSDAVLNRNLKESVRKIQQTGRHNWSFNDEDYSVNTVISQGAYALPSNFIRIEEGSVKWRQRVLYPIPYKTLKNTYTTLAYDNNPVYYSLRGSNMILYPRPDAIQTLEYSYRKALTAMSSDSDDSGMPADFDEALIAYAAYLSFSDIEGKQDLAVTQIQNFNELMKGLFATYLGTREESNFYMQFEEFPK